MIIIFRCLRCGHEWASKQKQPKVCPKCRSPYWDRPRKPKKNVTYSCSCGKFQCIGGIGFIDGKRMKSENSWQIIQVICDKCGTALEAIG